MGFAVFLAFTLALAFPGGGALSLTGKDALQYQWNPTINVFNKAEDSFELHRSEFKIFKYQDFDLRSVDRHAVNKNDLNKAIFFGVSRPSLTYKLDNQKLVLKYDEKHWIGGCDDMASLNCNSKFLLEYDPLIIGTLIPKDLANRDIEMKIKGGNVPYYGGRIIGFIIPGLVSHEIYMDVECLKADTGNTMITCRKESNGPFLYSVPDAVEDYKRTAILVFHLMQLKIDKAEAVAGDYSSTFDLVFKL